MASKNSSLRIGGLVGVGFLLSLPAIFLSVSGVSHVAPDVEFGDALWNLRGVDALLKLL